jgi:hypothetical protein
VTATEAAHLAATEAARADSSFEAFKAGAPMRIVMSGTAR